MDKEQTKRFISSTIGSFEKYLKKLCEGNSRNIKKAELITYWMSDYQRYLQFEEVFTPKKLKEYARGEIVKVNLGFNIGNEEGGLHYAVVVENNNTQGSGVITVIPLCSMKDDALDAKHQVNLGTEIFDSMNNKIKKVQSSHDREYEEFSDELKRAKKEISYIKEKIKDRSVPAYAVNYKIKQLEEKVVMLESMKKDITNKKNTLTKMQKEIDKMNKGTKALVGQITTISKMRIYDPKNDEDILAGLKISPKGLDLISDKMKELFFKS